MGVKASKGRVIRVSDDVYSQLEKKKKGFKSWDALMRCEFGLPARGKGKTRKLIELWLVPGTAQVFEKLSQARGIALKYAVLDGTNPETPIKLREVL